VKLKPRHSADAGRLPHPYVPVSASRQAAEKLSSGFVRSSVAYNDGCDGKTLRELLRLVEVNRERIERAWREFFG
jgi:hypothetical protein